MTLYEQFLDYTNFPTEEKFNEVVDQLPYFDSFDSALEFDPTYDNLAEKLFEYGVLADYPYLWVDSFNFEDKEVSIADIEDLELLEEINNLLKESGWTLLYYEEAKKTLSEESPEDERKKLLTSIECKATTEQLRDFYNSLNEE